MLSLPQRPIGRKRRIVYSRLTFAGTLGFRRRRWWRQPFTVAVYRVERYRLGDSR